MQKTTNYGLPQWVADDQIRMDDFNAAFAALDAALRSQSDAALSGLNAETAAREEAVSAETSARANALSALQTSLAAAIGSGGRTCRICTGSYTGTGSASVSLTTPFYPVLAFVQANGGTVPVVMLRTGSSMSGHQDFSSGSTTLSIGWGEHSVSWRSTVNSSSSTMAERAGNSSGKVYFYVVLGYDDAAE